MVSQEETSPGWILHVNHSCSKPGYCFPNSHREFIYSWLPAHAPGNACHGCFVTEAHGGNWAESLAGPTPGWPPSLSISTYRRRLRRGEGWTACWSCLKFEKLCSGELRLKDSQEGDLRNSYKDQKSYGNAKWWQSHRVWRLGHFSTQQPDLWKQSVTLLSPKPALRVVVLVFLLLCFVLHLCTQAF